MKPLLLYVFLFLSIIVNAQRLTQQQAISYAEKLYELEILSEKGKNNLIKQIERSEQIRLGQKPLQPEDLRFVLEISKGGILGFCVSAFWNETYYRSGIFEQQRIFKEWEKEGKKQPFAEEDNLRLFKEYEERFKNFEGSKIEQNILAEDTLPIIKQSLDLAPWLRPFIEEYGLVHQKRSVFGKTRTRTANDLLKISLIDNRVHQELLLQIQSGQLFSEEMVIAYAAQRIDYYESYDSNSNKQIAWLQNLIKKDVLSQENYQQLINTYKEYELKHLFDILPYCKLALVVDLSGYPLNPEQYYSLIFSEIRKIVPDFNYKNLEVKITEVPIEYDTETIEQRATISFEIDGRKYSTAFFHDYVRKVPQPDTVKSALPKISKDFYQGINKLLAARNSPQRLYYAEKSDLPQYFTNAHDSRWPGMSISSGLNSSITNSQEYVYNVNKIGLILLTKEQFGVLDTYKSDYFLFEQRHDNTFNTDHINQAIVTYEQLGLFVHLTADEIALAKEKVASSEINSYASILVCFPKTIVEFDWESGNLENPYEELTLAFAEASRGAFTPVNIVDEFEKSWKNKRTRYSFVFKAKAYKANLKMNGDWIDPEFMKLIEKAMAENKVDGKIYYCVDDREVEEYIFLTSAQYEYLKTHQPALFPE